MLGNYIAKRWLDRLWGIKTADLPWYRRVPINITRIGFVVVRDALEGQLTLQAMSLVYTTLLALVPLIALSFSLLKGFGMHNVLEPTLYQFLAPLGTKGQQLADQIASFVNNVNASVLGGVGVVLLIITVISMLQKVEGAFNRIWHVHRARLLLRRFSDYLSVVIIGPVLTVGALTLTATISSQKAVAHLTSIEPFGTLALIGAHVAPYILVIGAFIFIYIFAPNTRVRFKPALIGGIIGGALWQTAGLAFTLFTGSTTRVTAIYSGFAIVIFFLIWLYLSWLILLIGAEITFYAQNPDFVSRYHIHHYLGSRLREKLALLVMVAIGGTFHRRETPLSINDLTHLTHASGDAVSNICDQLYAASLLLTIEEPKPGYVPGRDMSDIPLAEILMAVRHYEPQPGTGERALHSLASVDRIANAVDRAITAAAEPKTLRDLVLEIENEKVDPALRWYDGTDRRRHEQ
ncbi:MAG TPA: YhjD/YihY/BrkB family envelope integrity protein [Gammaproteobacteria bacterium]|nr:YhjD/YihY/BrkB family envelope integrity protein [Gammaproteobacteria bacterium]